MSGLLTGNKTASAAVRGDDFYASPYAALPPLLVAEGRRLPKVLWEPAAGNGALVLPLRNRGYSVLATDLNDWSCPDSEADVDFLGPIAAQHGDNFAALESFGIVTNPPFNIIEEFVERAVKMSPYVALLCRLAFLESEGRMKWWKQVGLRRVHLIAERLPMMHRHNYDGPKLSNAGMCFAWFIFESGKRPVNQVPVRWISWKDACKKFPSTDADIPPEAKKHQRGLFEVISIPQPSSQTADKAGEPSPTCSPAALSQAKASEDNGRISGGAAPVTGEASRRDASRKASATSELTDVTAGETAQISQVAA